MMNREMMENIFENVCIENQMDWWQVFDGDLMDEVNNRICRMAGWTMDELENNDEYCDWTYEMGMDL